MDPYLLHCLGPVPLLTCNGVIPTLVVHYVGGAASHRPFDRTDLTDVVEALYQHDPYSSISLLEAAASPLYA